MTDQLPAVACVYAVYFDDSLVYLGSSVDVRNRFSEHKFRHGYGKNIITPWGDIPNWPTAFWPIQTTSTLLPPASEN